MIFIDHEALPVLEYSKESMTPTPSVLENIREIVSDPLNRNIVIIFSNQSVEIIEEHFSHLLKDGGLENLWIAAESGYLYRTGSSTGENSEWRKLRNLATQVWFNSVKKIMQTYTENVDGSIVEERESTLVWNHKNAEEEHGNMVVGELYSQIKSCLGSAPVEIVQGKGYLEVKPIKLKKTKLLKQLLAKITQQTKIDYLLYLGADTGNENVYNFLLNKKSSDQYFTKDTHHKYICTLGKKPSSALYYVDCVQDVEFMLTRFKKATHKRKRNRSYADLSKISSSRPFN